MKMTVIRAILGILALAALAPASLVAQTPAPPAQAAPVYQAAQLDQLLAPIALYPDELLSQILMASTYPLEVVEAQRWVQDPKNAGLKGDQLTAALQDKDWDPSVKSLVPFPQILVMMSDRLDWMQKLGDAFLAQQSDVMDAVQRLRQQAQAAGTLKSSPQQTVTTQDQTITVEPANPDTVYVPVYDPTVVYGTWPYPDYPPYYFPPHGPGPKSLFRLPNKTLAPNCKTLCPLRLPIPPSFLPQGLRHPTPMHPFKFFHTPNTKQIHQPLVIDQ